MSIVFFQKGHYLENHNSNKKATVSNARHVKMFKKKHQFPLSVCKKNSHHGFLQVQDSLSATLDVGQAAGNDSKFKYIATFIFNVKSP